MKEIGLESTGGRVRWIRQEAKLPMPDFAKKLGISSNYVGLIERGKRNASPSLLRRISSVMGVSYKWLVNGGPLPPPKQKSRTWTDAVDVTADPAQAINPQLYLSIVLMMAPNISKDVLATILAAPPKTIDDILAGESNEYDPHWSNGYSVLARNLDLPTLCRDLHNLEIFLWQEETAKRNMSLLRTLKQRAAEAFDAVEVSSINAQPPEAVPIRVPYTDIIMREKENPNFTWYFKCLPEQDDPEEFFPDDAYDKAVALTKQYSFVSIVLTSEAEYDSICSYCEKLEANDDALAELNIPSSLPRGISFIFFDPIEEKIDEWEFSDDDLSDDDI